jgi:hypothetical protein
MIEHADERDPEVAVAALEERVRGLEDRLTTVADAVRVLAHGLEDLPVAEPGGRPAAEAARRAYDLLLLAEPHQPGPQAASPDA